MKTYTILCATLTIALAPLAARGAEDAASKPASPPTTITVDYVNADVADVLRALAAQSGISIALNPSVKGQVTLHLRNKSVDEALGIVTNLAGLQAKKVNGTYVIAPHNEMRQTLDRLGISRVVNLEHLSAQAAADLAQNAFSDLTARPQGKAVLLTGAPDDVDGAEKMLRQNDLAAPDNRRVSERIPLGNRSAAQIAPALAKMVPGVNVEPAGNAIIVSGTRSDVEAARAAASMLDVAQNTDFVTKVYRIKYSTADQLAQMVQQAYPDVQVIAGPESAAPAVPQFRPLSGQFVGGIGIGSQTTNSVGPYGTNGVPGQPNTQNGQINKNALSLILKGPSASVQDALNLLDVEDQAPRQVMVEAKVVDTSPEELRNLGVEWQWNQFLFVERPQLSGNVVPQTPLPVGPAGMGTFGRIQFTPSATLNALITNKKAKLLASPQIAVLNDQDASIFIGDTLRFQTLAQSSATAGNQFTVVEVPVGIILLVHPRINDDGNITLRVHPVVSTVSAISNGLPQTSAREAETIVRVKDGDTIVIGGLIRDDDVKAMSKIPFLGDLPILGYLFKNEYRDHRRSEVMVFLTIKILPH
jgi:type II secretory pathway component GspD/PulD (secretin)